MQKIDLIINALEKAKDGWQSFDEYEKALAVARELRELKPVGVFEYDEENNVWEELTPNCEGVRLYALGDEK